MNQFERLCRQLGLMVHHVAHPHKDKQTRQVSRKVEEEKPSSTLTLRRTTIEEVEINPKPRP